jgi:hypothetical protein
MRRDEFERMSVKEVLGLARAEDAVQRGKPLYHGRPWSRVLDEMDEAEVRTVGALEATRIAVLHDGVSRRDT